MADHTWHPWVRTNKPRLAHLSVTELVSHLCADKLDRWHVILELEHRADEQDAEAIEALDRLRRAFGY